MKYAKLSEQGQVIVLFVLGLIGLLAMIALAIDGGNAFADRRNAQNAVDNAAAAASLAWIREESPQTAGDFIINQNSYTNANSTWTYDLTDITCSNGAVGIVIRVDLNTTVDTYLAGLVGWDQLHNKVHAKVRACKVGPPLPLYANNSMFSTKDTSCDSNLTDAGIGVGGSSLTTFLGGGMGSASSDADCIRFQGASNVNHFNNCANISSPATGGIDWHQGSVDWPDGCGTIIYNTLPPPPPDRLEISCSGPAVQSGNTLSPGSYSGTFPPAGVDTLQSGTYCVNGFFQLNAGQTLVGNGVTIVMESGDITWNGGSSPQLTAPSGGTWKGLLIYAPPSDIVPTGLFTFNGNGDSVIQGTVLAQTAQCRYLGTQDTNTGAGTQQSIQLICYTILLNGSQEAIIVYDPTVLYTPQEPPSYEQTE